MLVPCWRQGPSVNAMLVTGTLTVMLAIQTRLCGLLAGSARTAGTWTREQSLGSGRVDSLLVQGALMLDEFILVLVCSIIICWGGREDRLSLYLLEGDGDDN